MGLANAMNRLIREEEGPGYVTRIYHQPPTREQERRLYLLAEQQVEERERAYELETGEELSTETGWTDWETRGSDTGYSTHAHETRGSDTGAGALRERVQEARGERIQGKITRLEGKAMRLGVAPRIAAMSEEVTERQIVLAKKKVENDIKYPDWQPFGIFQPAEVGAGGTIITNVLITRDMWVKNIFFTGTTDLFRITRFVIQGGPMFQGANLSPSNFRFDSFAVKEQELNMRLPVNAQIGLDVLNFTAATPGSIGAQFFGYMIPASQSDYRG